MKNAVIRLKRQRAEQIAVDEDENPIEDYEEMNLRLQKQLMKKDAELVAKEAELQKKIEELHEKNTKITFLEDKISRRRTKFLGFIYMLAVGLIVGIIFKSTSWAA